MSKHKRDCSADIVREWSEHDMNESYDSDYLINEFGAGHLEERIALEISNAAASMRSRCIEKVKELARERAKRSQPNSKDHEYNQAVSYVLFQVAETLELVEIQEQEKR